MEHKDYRFEVEVWGKRYQIQVDQKSKSVWIAQLCWLSTPGSGIILEMDYRAVIAALRRELVHIDRAIAQLEDLNSRFARAAPRSEPSRRGRKFVGVEERKQVSERMKRYWAKRRSDGA